MESKFNMCANSFVIRAGSEMRFCVNVVLSRNGVISEELVVPSDTCNYMSYLSGRKEGRKEKNPMAQCGWWK